MLIREKKGRGREEEEYLLIGEWGKVGSLGKDSKVVLFSNEKRLKILSRD